MPAGFRWRLAAILATVTLLAACTRILFTALTELPSADPWRHLALVRNIRAGAGFTLYAEQPYIWYSPVWYYVAAIVPPESIGWVAAVFSTAAAPLFAGYLWRSEGKDVKAALAGGLLFALFGPLVRFTCQFGAEAFAIFLLCASLLLSTIPGSERGDPVGATSGLLFGLSVAARSQFVLDGLLFLPALRRPRRAAWWACGALVPLAAHWWRNHLVIAANEFVFTWDGVATRARDYTALSTLVPQLQPSVSVGARRLYEQILPRPEWLARSDLLLFAAISFGCVMACRRVGVILAAIVSVAYFTFFDDTFSAHFTRIWLGLLPVLCIAVAVVASRVAGDVARSWRAALAAAMIVLLMAAGSADLRPERFMRVEAVTPPPTMVTNTHYMVAGGFYHPESLIWRYPDKHFIGLPRDAGDLADFERDYPEYRLALWHRWGALVQGDVFAALEASGRYEVVARGRSGSGYEYRVIGERRMAHPEPRDPARADDGR